MNPFSTVTSVVTPLSKVNVDTDQIIPKQFLKIVTKSGFGKFLFFDWRYGKHNEPIPDFVLNDSRYGDSHILVTGDNFGCGSSREHAVWSLLEYGFSVVVAPRLPTSFTATALRTGCCRLHLTMRQLRSCSRSAAMLQSTCATRSSRLHPLAGRYRFR